MTVADDLRATWTFCPECGSEEIRYEEGRHKQCANCGQEWFSDLDYRDVYQTKLRRAALAASQQQGPEIKGLEPSLAYQLAEEATCDCGAGHGALEPHISTCAWQTSQWKAWGDAFNAYPEMSEAFSHAYYLITGKSPQWGPAFGINEALREIDDAQRVLRLSIKSAPSVGAEEPTSEPLVTLTTVRLASVRAAIRSLPLDEAQPSFAAAALVERLGDYLEQKEVYNALTYLARKGELERLGYGHYLIKNLLSPFSSTATSRAPIPEGMVLVTPELCEAVLAQFSMTYDAAELRDLLLAATPAPQAEPGAGE